MEVLIFLDLPKSKYYTIEKAMSDDVLVVGKETKWFVKCIKPLDSQGNRYTVSFNVIWNKFEYISVSLTYISHKIIEYRHNVWYNDNN